MPNKLKILMTLYWKYTPPSASMSDATTMKDLQLLLPNYKTHLSFYQIPHNVLGVKNLEGAINPLLYSH